MCCFCRKYIMFEPKMYRIVMYLTLNNDAKFEWKLNFALKNDMINLTIF